MVITGGVYLLILLQSSREPIEAPEFEKTSEVIPKQGLVNVPIFHITQLLGINLQQIFVLVMWNKSPKGRCCFHRPGRLERVRCDASSISGHTRSGYSPGTTESMVKYHWNNTNPKNMPKNAKYQTCFKVWCKSCKSILMAVDAKPDLLMNSSGNYPH